MRLVAKAWLLLATLYIAFVASGFVHEGGHILVGRLVGVETSGFSPADCLRLRCQVPSPESLSGWPARAFLFAGGFTASLAWGVVYLLMVRWHRRKGWWVGALTAAFAAAELTASLLEGGSNSFYSRHEMWARVLIATGGLCGVVVQLTLTGQLHRVPQLVGRVMAQMGATASGTAPSPSPPLDTARTHVLA